MHLLKFQRDTHLIRGIIFLWLCLMVSREAQCEVTKDQIGQTCMAALKDKAEDVHIHKDISILDGKSQNDLIVLMGSFAGSGDGELIVLLKKTDSCNVVLSTYGRGISVDQKSGGAYPNIYTYNSTGKDEETGALDTEDVTYFWNGTGYEDTTLRDRKNKGKQLNEQAVLLFKQKKIEAAIKIWRRIGDELDVADAEVLNNLGFAYYELARRTNDKTYYSHSPQRAKPRAFSYYEKADRYLQMSLEKEPNRWSALLNMGDLEYDLNDFKWAIIYYDKLLKVKSDYKYVEKIKKRIEELKRKPADIGVELVVSKYPSGEKDITYTRVDNRTVLRQGHYETGQIRFRETIIDGYDNGEYREWNQNGKIYVTGQHKMGEETGKYTYYNSDGSIIRVRTYKDDGTYDDDPKDK